MIAKPVNHMQFIYYYRTFHGTQVKKRKHLPLKPRYQLYQFHTRRYVFVRSIKLLRINNNGKIHKNCYHNTKKSKTKTVRVSHVSETNKLA